MLTFDLETTGVNVYEDRIVTAYLGVLDSDGSIMHEQNWLVDPGVEIPEGAAAVHGITTEQARAEGNPDIGGVVDQLHRIIVAECSLYGDPNPLPLAGYNLSYDLTLLESERKRHTPKTPALNFDHITVLDGLVLDKATDKYRKGSRKLIDAARHYGIPITEEEAHAASFDAIASGRIIQAILARKFAGTPLRDIHDRQVGWKAEQAAGLEAYFRQKGTLTEPVDGGWPIQSGRALEVAA